MKYAPRFLLIILPLLLHTIANSQTNSSPVGSDLKEVSESLNYDDREDSFSNYKLLSRFKIRLEDCKCQYGFQGCKRSNKCRELLQEIADELKIALASTRYSDFGKSRIYLELYKVSKYADQSTISYLDSAIWLYQARIKLLEIPAIEGYYFDYRKEYLREIITLMENYVRKRHTSEFNDIDQLYERLYPSYPPGTVVCGTGSEGIEPGRRAKIAVAMYANGYYKIASEYN